MTRIQTKMKVYVSFALQTKQMRYTWTAAMVVGCFDIGVCLDCAIDTMKRNNSCSMCRSEVVQILEIETLNATEGLFKVLNSFFVSTFHKRQKQLDMQRGN